MSLHYNESNNTYFIGETEYRLSVNEECCSVYFDDETKTIHVLVDEVNLLPPNVKQRLTNKFYKACKKFRTSEFQILPIRPIP